MSRPWRWCCFAALLATILSREALGQSVASTPARPTQRERFTLGTADRVVLIGGTWVERDAAHGYLEAALTSRFGSHAVQFRNLGWSGDNVFGEARAGFGSVADGFEHLREHVLALKPTVILLNYGANESFAGKAGLDAFLSGLDALLAMLDETGARIVFISSPPHEDMGRPLPDPAEHNKDLKIYSDAIAEVAAKRRAPFVNLYDLLGKKLRPPTPVPLTDNGLHLTAYGYWRATPVIEQALGLPPRRWQIEIDAANRNISARGTVVGRARFSPARLTFRALDETLPLAPPPAESPANAVEVGDRRIVRVLHLPAGKYALRIADHEVRVGTAAQWAAGLGITSGPDFDQAEKLRRTIVAKNLLYFRRWRPQNETYLFGFRKHEQGQNAVEIPQFDPLVAAKEAVIHGLSAPAEREYELIKLDSK